MDKENGNTEEDVLNIASELISNVSELVVVNFPARDLARLKTFHRIAQKNGRKLVLSFKHAYLLEQFSALGGDEYPSIDDPHLCFYADRKGWGLSGRDDYPQNIVEQDYYSWEREYLYMDNTVNFREVRENQEQYLFYCNYFQLNELLDIMPKAGSRYVRSVCEPFSEEMMFENKLVMNWLELLGLGEAYQIHASGHANYPELKKMVEDIKPKKVIPIHTEHPELFKQMHGNVECPKLEGK